MKIKSVHDIIEAGGGSMNCAIMLGIEQINVLSWKAHGIPRKMWEKLTEKFDVTIEEIYTIDKKLRAPKP